MGENQQFGQGAEGSKPLVAWDVDEMARHQRGFLWYAVMLTVGASLLIYAVASANFLFALIVLMLALIVYMTSLQGPDEVHVEISDLGVAVGETFYRYRDISRFWFVYDPPEVKSLYLDFKDVLVPRIAVPLEDQNPNVVRAALAQYVPEDMEENDESFSELFARILKL